MTKRFLSTLLVLLIIVSAIPISAAAAEGLTNFSFVNEYTPGLFTDVDPNEWYAVNVEMAYRYGLINGNSPTTFGPDSNLKISETIKLAACMHSIYFNGSLSFIQGTPWYQVYVDYAKENRIITSDYKNYDAYVNRAEFAKIFANALPDDALQAINTVDDNALPDVRISDDFGSAAYKLYRAGILTGNDDKGTFYPNSNIMRKEAAAIVTRMADPSLRKSVRFISENNESGLSLNVNSLSMNRGDVKEITVTNRFGPGTKLAFLIEDTDIAVCDWGKWIDDSTIAVPIFALQPGSAVIYFRVTDENDNVLSTISLTVNVSEASENNSSDISMSFSSSMIRLFPEVTGTVIVSIDSGRTTTIRYMVKDPSAVTCEWGELIDYSTVPLYIKALSEGMTTIRIDLIDTVTDEILSSGSIKVVINTANYYTVGSVPDFGSYMEIPLYDYHIKSSLDHMYLYAAVHIDNVDEALSGYADLLYHSGYNFYTSFTSHEGYLVNVYYNSSEDLYVYIGLGDEAGITCLYVIVTPDI